jgi:hypothetical protein
MKVCTALTVIHRHAAVAAGQAPHHLIAGDRDQGQAPLLALPHCQALLLALNHMHLQARDGQKLSI